MMRQEIERYLTEERGIESDVVREMLCDKVMKYDDIAEEFEKWLEVRAYEDGVRVGVYTARKIHELAPGLEGIGVYNFLVTLRDSPEEARKIMDEGFVVK